MARVWRRPSYGGATTAVSQVGRGGRQGGGGDRDEGSRSRGCDGGWWWVGRADGRGVRGSFGIVSGCARRPWFGRPCSHNDRRGFPVQSGASCAVRDGRSDGGVARVGCAGSWWCAVSHDRRDGRWCAGTFPGRCGFDAAHGCTFGARKSGGGTVAGRAADTQRIQGGGHHGQRMDRCPQAPG
jgi:hypothetical protein